MERLAVVLARRAEIVEFPWEEMVAVRMRDDAVINFGIVDSEAERMGVSVAGKVDQQIVVDQRLRTGAEMSSARFAGFPAGFATAKDGREPFRGGGSEILQFHDLFLSKCEISVGVPTEKIRGIA